MLDLCTAIGKLIHLGRWESLGISLLISLCSVSVDAVTAKSFQLALCKTHLNETSEILTFRWRKFLKSHIQMHSPLQFKCRVQQRRSACQWRVSIGCIASMVPPNASCPAHHRERSILLGNLRSTPKSQNFVCFRRAGP